MTSPATLRPDLQWKGRHLLDGHAAVRSRTIREVIQRCLWNPALRLWATPLAMEGAALQTPAVYVANHASHADTALVRSAAGASLRQRLAVAAADDYFFSTDRRAAAFSLAVGAFPFPRHGDVGLQRANALLTEGWSVLLYPQGTRSPGSDYRPGALRLAGEGWPVVPIGIAGTAAVLPKGARFPRRAPVAVVFGQALEPADLRGHGARAVFVDAIRTVARRAEQLVST